MEFVIQRITDAPPEGLNQVEAARELFEEYGLFLKATQSCGYFDYATFTQEIEALPGPYTERNGNLLLVYADTTALACVAFRVSFAEGPRSCEIKRLYVRPGYRSAGLARTLVVRLLMEARAAGYTRAILDTDVEHMPGARELYTSLGFAEYKPRWGTIAFLERLLV